MWISDNSNLRTRESVIQRFIDSSHYQGLISSNVAIQTISLLGKLEAARDKKTRTKAIALKQIVEQREPHHHQNPDIFSSESSRECHGVKSNSYKGLRAGKEEWRKTSWRQFEVCKNSFKAFISIYVQRSKMRRRGKEEEFITIGTRQRRTFR